MGKTGSNKTQLTAWTPLFDRPIDLKEAMTNDPPPDLGATEHEVLAYFYELGARAVSLQTSEGEAFFVFFREADEDLRESFEDGQAAQLLKIRARDELIFCINYAPCNVPDHLRSDPEPLIE